MNNIVPMSIMQENIYFEYLSFPNQPYYIIQSIYTIKGRLDKENLIKAAKYMVHRYPIFRTTFELNDEGEPIQVIQNDEKLDYRFIDISDLSKEEQENSKKVFLENDKKQGFDLKAGPLIRGTVIKNSSDIFEIIISYHHILLDGWSASLAKGNFYEVYNQLKKKKKPNMIHIGIGILTVLLVVFIVILMQLVSNIQGTARVVNYAGLIRGETQRIIKLENSGQREDELIKEVQSFIEGLRHGNDQLKLVRLKDDDFQDKMKELDEYFISLHKEIYRVRTVGYEHTDIISKSERFFKICDEATGLAEVYAQRKATSLATLEKFITADIVVLMLLIGYEFIKAIRFAAMNRILQHKAYLDNATGLPNKNKCEEILGELNPPEDIIVCSFDLNNLRRINDSMGHDAGDAYIYRFAV